MISENPYIYGQVLIINHTHERVKVLAVVDDVLDVSLAGNFEKYGYRLHWKEAQKKFTLEPTKGWECLTAENWKASRDNQVWCRDKTNQVCIVSVLINYNHTADFPFTVIGTLGMPVVYKEVSIYDSDGVEAK